MNRAVPRRPITAATVITRAVLAIQLAVMVAVTMLRLMAGGGWLLVIYIFGGFVVVFMLSILAVAATLPILRTGRRWARTACVLALTTVYGSLLTAAATMPEFTDVSDQYGVAISGMFGQPGVLTTEQAEIYNTISGIAVDCYLASTAATVVLAGGIYLATRTRRRGPHSPTT